MPKGLMGHCQMYVSYKSKRRKKKGEGNLFEAIMTKTPKSEEKRGYMNPRISIKKHDNQRQRKIKGNKKILAYTQTPQ